MVEPPPKTPLAHLITDARSGALGVRMDPEDFARVECECRAFQEVIREIQTSVDEVSQVETWGIGDHPGSRLTSAPVLAARFRTKSRGTPGSFYEVLDEHWQVVEDIRALHAAVRDRLVQADDEFAARLRAELTRLSVPGTGDR